MKLLFRGLLVVVCILAVLAGAGIAYLALRRPAQRPPSSERIEATPARLVRGEYLVEHVSDCLLCHSEARFERFGLPRVPGTAGKGGFAFGKDFGIPGVLPVRNITPDRETGIGSWTDGEILRAIREGVDRDGHALFPMMPYQQFAQIGRCLWCAKRPQVARAVYRSWATSFGAKLRRPAQDAHVWRNGSVHLVAATF